jgi:hypothetical protein
MKYNRAPRNRGLLYPCLADVIVMVGYNISSQSYFRKKNSLIKFLIRRSNLNFSCFICFRNFYDNQLEAAVLSKSYLKMFHFFQTGKNEQKWDPLISLQRKEAQRPSLSWLGLSLDLLLVLCSIAFIVFANLAMASNGQLLTEGSRAQYLLDVTYYVS